MNSRMNVLGTPDEGLSGNKKLDQGQDELLEKDPKETED